MALKKYENERRQRASAIGERLDLTHNPNKKDNINALCLELERAKKRLQEKIALSDEKAVRKLEDIISNLNQTIERSK